MHMKFRRMAVIVLATLVGFAACATQEGGVGDAVIVPGPGGDRCSIASIRRLSPDDLEVLLGDDTAPDNRSSDAGECKPGPDTTG
jgi:hypothetical protein